MATTSVTFGQTSSGAVAPGDTEIVYNGGTTTGTVVSSGGYELVSSGGVALATSVQRGGDQDVDSGGRASGTILSGTAGAQAHEVVYAGGTTTGTQVGSQGVEYVYSGGIASAALVSSGGLLRLGGINHAGGSSMSATLYGGGSEVVSYGGVASGTVVSSGGTEEVSSSGSAISAMVLSSGTLQVDAFGSASFTTVSSGGSEIVLGQVTSTVVSGGGSATVSSGGIANGTIVSSGGRLVVSGGRLSGTDVASGGTLSGVNAASATYQDTTIDGGSAYFFYDRAATISGLDITNGGQAYLTSAIDVTAESGGSLTVRGGTVASLTLGSGGSAGLTRDAGASGTLVSGGSLSVGGANDFGEAVATTVESGGLEIVYAGGQSFGTVVSSGGTLDLFGSAQVTDSGQLISPFSGTGAAYAPPVFAGGTEIVDSGYAVDRATVQGGALQQLIVAANGSASDLVVTSGGIVIVSSGGTMGGNSGILVGSGGHITLHSGASGLDALVITSGGEYDAYGADALAPPGYVFSGGNLAVGSGKVLSGLRIGSAFGKIIPDTYVVNGGVLSTTVLDSPGSIVVESGGRADQTFVLSGTFAVQAGGSATAARVDSGAMATISSGGSLDGGRIYGGLLDIQSGASTSGGITFGSGTSGHGGTLEVDAAPAGGGALLSGATISGFVEGDTINLAGIAYDSGGSATLEAGNVLDIAEGGKTYTLQLDPTQDYSGEMFVLSDPTGTDITVEPAVCFAEGTRIRVARDEWVVEVAVEDLVVGDLAVTASGSRRPVRWLGHRTLDCRRHPRPHEMHPVRIAAHAFGEGRPVRDLRLSPGHPVLVGADADSAGGQLVPIMCLVNGTSVRRVAVDAVTYWHVELDAHDILLAENLPAESYLDWGDRAFFTEGSDHALHNPDFVVPGLAGRCRPVAVDGPVVEAERGRLDAVFATSLRAACAWPDAETNRPRR